MARRISSAEEIASWLFLVDDKNCICVLSAPFEGGTIMTFSMPTDMDTGRAMVEWTKPKPRFVVDNTGTEWVADLDCIGYCRPYRFDPRRRLTGLALRLLANSNAWQKP